MPTVPLPFKPKKKWITQKVFFKRSARTKSWKLGHTHPVGSDPNLCFISFFSFFFLICKQSFPEPCQGITRQACSRRCSFSQTDINVEQSSSLHDQSLTILWRLFTEQNVAVPSENVWLIIFKLWSAKAGLVMNQNWCELSYTLSFSCSRTHFRHRPSALGLLLLIKAVRCACASPVSLPNLSPVSLQSSFLKRMHSKHSDSLAFWVSVCVCTAQFAKMTHSPIPFSSLLYFFCFSLTCVCHFRPLYYTQVFMMS